MIPNIARRTYKYDHTIGMDDFSGRAFRNLADVAIGTNEMLYVLQRGEAVHLNVSVKICSMDEEWFGDFGTYGTEPGAMGWPAGIAVDADRSLYVTDEWNHRVTVFDVNGNLLRHWGSEGIGDGQFNRPSGIMLDHDNTLLVVDAQNHRIQRFTMAGEFLKKWGSYGAGYGELNSPWGVASHNSGDVYVTDWRNDRVQVFSHDGEFIRGWGISGSGDGEFNRPAGIAVDSDGDVYVADWHNNRVQVFDATGQFITQLIGEATMSQWGAQLMDANPIMAEQRRNAKYPELEARLFLPRGVKVDAQNRVIIVDSCKGRLQIYRKLPD